MKKENRIFIIYVAGFQLFIFLSGIFSFAFILSEVSFVSSNDKPYDPLDASAGAGNHPPSASLDPSNPPLKVPADPKASSSLSKFFGVKEVGGTADALLTGLQWAVVAYGVGQLIGGLLGLELD